jgi:hypothetical protein
MASKSAGNALAFALVPRNPQDSLVGVSMMGGGTSNRTLGGNTFSEIFNDGPHPTLDMISLTSTDTPAAIIFRSSSMENGFVGQLQ